VIDWRLVPLGDVAEEVTVGFVGSMTSHYRDEGIPFLRSQNVKSHRVDPEGMLRVSPTFHRSILKSRLRPGDVVTVRTGVPGTSAVIPDWLPEANCADLVVTRPGPRLDPRWLSYYLNSAADGYINSRLVGAVQQHFNVGEAKSMRLLLPPLPEQRAIAEVLGALDDKIAANSLMSWTADELASALFQRAAVRSEREEKLGALATIVLGGTPDRARPDYWAEAPGVAWVASGKANEARIHRPTEWISDLGLRESSAKLMPVGATVVAITGATLGQVGRLEIEAAGNQSLVGVWADMPDLNDWLHFAVRHSIGVLVSRATGGAQQHVNKNDVANLRVPVPAPAVLREFGTAARPLLQLAAAADRESLSLAELRDTLLPALMDGSIRVRDAIATAGEVL
jgi:type I restriction enzyme, S subunit